MTATRHFTLNHRQRAFARGIAEGLSKSDAQMRAGYLPNRKNANLLLRDDRILAEIERVRTVIESERYRAMFNRGAE